MPTLNWIGKSDVINHHNDIPYKTLKKNKKLSIGNTKNMLIQGDNLLALKSLLPYYKNKIKCIYIDPPYNTGNESWIYNDKVNSPTIQEWLNKTVGNPKDISKHDKWLCMMYPRLQLLKKLLSDNGVIFISIDDNEQAQLKLLCNEIFGEENFIAQIVWEKSIKNDSRYVSKSHDYILCYVKDILKIKECKSKWRLRKDGIDEIYDIVNELKLKHNDNYSNIEKDLQIWFNTLPENHPSKNHKHYNKIDSHGVYFAGDISCPRIDGPRYDILHPKTKQPVKTPKTGWRYAKQETMLTAIKNNKIHFGKDHTTVPQHKRYLENTENQVMSSVFYKDGRLATRQLREILGDNLFNNPKDVQVISKIISLVTSNNDIILDSFAGSGTTAQAVLELNKQDGGNRRFILIEIEPDIAIDITYKRLVNVIERL